ncbi:AAA family ATPase [Clostridium sp. AN503]|uniref:AAA family ATPase n=1 Tax=Clostridium sp. AN503 TaxID=3160598 RepID=UPI0034582A0F
MDIERLIVGCLQKKEVDNLKLISVKIEGFRNIDSAEIRFDHLTSLVSLNSYGKSNLMKAIDFAVDFIKKDKEEKDRMMSWTAGLPLNKKIDSKNFMAEFMFSYMMDKKEYYVNYGFEFIWIKNHDAGKEIVREWLNVKENEKSQKYSKLISRDGVGTYRTSVTGRCTNVLNIDQNELMVNKLLLNESLYYYDILRQLNEIKVYVDRHLDASEWYSRNSLIIRKNADEFDLDEVESIPRVIFFLKQKYKEKYELLKDVFCQLFPNIMSIDVREIDLGKNSSVRFSGDIPYVISNKVYSMYVQDRTLNQPIAFTNLSDGAKRIFLMLTYTILADISGITLIAFEEPENSVHPSLLQSYLNILSQLAKDCKIIIASHSPYIIQYVNAESLYIGKPNDHGLADFAKIDNRKINQLLKDASDSNESIGSYIFDLLSGGDDEIGILLDYLEK